MISLIQEWQEKCRNQEISMSELLLFSLSIAKKLDLPAHFVTFLTNELNGYDSTSSTRIPDYRIVPCELIGFDGYFWDVKVKFSSQEEEEHFSKFPFAQSIVQLEELYHFKENSEIEGSLPVDEKRQFMNNPKNHFLRDIKQFICPSNIRKIIVKVRYLILNYALDLEKAGIWGEEMSSHEAKKSAELPNIYCNIYGGSPVINPQGPVQLQTSTNDSSQSLVQSTCDPEIIAKFRDLVNQIQKKIDSFNLTPKQKLEIEKIVESLHADMKSSSPKKSILKQGFDSLISFVKNHGFESADLLLKFFELSKKLSD